MIKGRGETHVIPMMDDHHRKFVPVLASPTTAQNIHEEYTKVVKNKPRGKRMKLTQEELQNIIKEELDAVVAEKLNEQDARNVPKLKRKKPKKMLAITR